MDDIFDSLFLFLVHCLLTLERTDSEVQQSQPQVDERKVDDRLWKAEDEPRCVRHWRLVETVLYPNPNNVRRCQVEVVEVSLVSCELTGQRHPS